MDSNDRETTSIELIKQKTQELRKQFQSLSKAGEVGYFICGEIANAIDVLTMNAIKRLAEFDSALASCVEKLEEDKIDRDYLKSEGFARVVLGILNAASLETEDDKIKYFAQILANWMTVEYTENEKRACYWRMIEELEGIHIAVLKMWDTTGNSFSQDAREKLGLTVEDVEAVCEDLASRSLLKRIYANSAGARIERPYYEMHTRGKRLLKYIGETG